MTPFPTPLRSTDTLRRDRRWACRDLKWFYAQSECCLELLGAAVCQRNRNRQGAADQFRRCPADHFDPDAFPQTGSQWPRD